MPIPLPPRIARNRWWRQAITLSSFVPDQQKEKLALIADANNLLDATINPFEVLPPPTDAETVAAFKSTARKAARRRRATRRTSRRRMRAAWPMRWTRVVKAGPAAMRARHAKPWCRA